MKHKFFILLLAALLLALGGCALAEPAGDAEPDRLIGTYLTTEPLGAIPETDFGKPMKIVEDTVVSSGSEPRLWAERVTRILTGEDGDTAETTEFQFPGGGALLCTARIEDGDGVYHTVTGAQDFADTGCAFRDTDEGTSVELRGTAAVIPGGEERCFYFNPVYQTADGRVYARGGSGFMVTAENRTEGTLYSEGREESAEVRWNGEARTWRASVTLTLTVMFRPARVTVTQFGADGAVLARTSYRPAETPDRIELDAGAAYLIVETEKTAPDGSAVTTRELLDAGSDTLNTYAAGENSLCVCRSAELVWPGEEDNS